MSIGARGSPCDRGAIMRELWRRVVIVYTAISLAVFGSNLLGDALRDTRDPRLRGA